MNISLSWSGGKDAAYCLHQLLTAGEHQVVELHCVVDAATRRVAQHDIHESLIAEQARALGVPLRMLYLSPAAHGIGGYEPLMRRYFRECADRGMEAVVFGDIFLGDLKTYREQLLVDSGLTALFPLWNQSTRELLGEVINVGFKAVMCAADTQFFAQEQVGKILDHTFADNLPATVDPCGENGEFHTFVFDGPPFAHAVRWKSEIPFRKKYTYKTVDPEGKIRLVDRRYWVLPVSPRTA